MDLKRYSTRAWIISNPRILYRILRGYTRAILLKKNTLRTVHILPTFDCQARCQMCSVRKFDQGRKNLLSLADYESIADQAGRMGAIAASVLGGEPLLVKNLEEILRVFKSRHFFLSIVTNGIAITRDNARRLRRAGLSVVFFGLESLDDEVNDRLRGFPGQSTKVRESIAICQGEGFHVGLSTVLFPGEEKRYADLAEYCRSHRLLMNICALSGVQSGDDAGPASRKEYERLARFIKRYPRAGVDWAFSYFFRPRCPSGKEKITITCYGDVMGCTLNPISFGNIRQEPLKRIWERAGRFSQFQKNSDRCLAAFDRSHIDRYLRPLAHFEKEPVHFVDHPAITPETEPGLFEF